MSVAQQIKDRLDIVQYVGEHVPGLKKAGRYYKAPCPFHNEKTPSFVVNPDTQSWRCFGACAEGGDIFTFAQKKHGWSFTEALRELGNLAGVDVHQRTPQQKQREEHLERLRGMLQTAADFFHDLLLSDADDARAALQYTLQKRGFSMQTIRDWQIGFAPDGWQNMLSALGDLGYQQDDILEAGLASRNERGHIYDRFRNRLMIPIRDERGRVVGFGARALSPDDNPKYLNSPQTPIFDKSSTLFGLDRAKHSIRESETAVVVEGYMDVIQAHQAGYSNVIAQMGTAMTEAQLGLIAPRYAKRIILALDADEAGQNATRRSLEVARKALEADFTGKLSVDMRVLQIDDAKDPDDVLRETPDLWEGYIAQAMPVADFVINLETAELDTSAGLPEKQAIARRVLPILSASENNLYTQENLQKLALRLRISESDLVGWAQEIRRQEAAQQARKQQRDAQQQRDTQHPPAPSAAPPMDSAQMPPAPPPLDEVYISSSEPPPLHTEYDEDDDFYLPPIELDIGLPPATGDAAQAQPASKPAPLPMPQLSSRNASRAKEERCLVCLLKHPNLLAHANRKLREIAQTQRHLDRGDFDVSALDFTSGDFQIILETWFAALQQDEHDPISYLLDRLDEQLVEQVEHLLAADDDALRRKVGGRFAAELAQVWDKVSRRPSSDEVIMEDLLQRVLELREYRLARETREIRFFLEDAQRNKDREAQELYVKQASITMRALQRLHQELQQRPTVI